MLIHAFENIWHIHFYIKFKFLLTVYSFLCFLISVISLLFQSSRHLLTWLKLTIEALEQGVKYVQC